MLFRAIVRRDVKPLAKALIARFGSFAEAMAARPERLREIDGLGESAICEIKIVEASARRLTRGNLQKRTVLSSFLDVIDYCRTAMAYAEREEFRILFLDKRNALIADEVQGVGTVDHTPVYPREVVRRALELGATALILAHNHPSGDPTPSTADIRMTQDIVAIAQPFGIAVHRSSDRRTQRAFELEGAEVHLSGGFDISGENRHKRAVSVAFANSPPRFHEVRCLTSPSRRSSSPLRCSWKTSTAPCWRRPCRPWPLDLHEDPVALKLALTSYLLSLAVFIPLSGWVADRFGARRVFRAAIVVFTFGSILCGLSTSLAGVVLSRIVQGLGGAMMVPVGRLVLLRVAPRTNSCARSPGSPFRR